jgi:hypothetical protein
MDNMNDNYNDSYSNYSNDDLKTVVAQLKAALERERICAQHERQGRIRMQIALASALARIRSITGCSASAGATSDHADGALDDDLGLASSCSISNSDNINGTTVAQPANGLSISGTAENHIDHIDHYEKKQQITSTPSSNSHSSLQYPLTVIGTVQSCYTTRNGTPRQPSLATRARSKLVLRRAEIPYIALQGLHEFSHCWVIFLFHQNTDAHKRMGAGGGMKGGAGGGIKGTVIPPRYGKSVGVLSTR